MVAAQEELKKHPGRRTVLCALVFAFSVTLGISIGYNERTAEFNPSARQASNYSVVNVTRSLSLQCNLVGVDATAGTMLLDWTILDDSACSATSSTVCPGVNPNSTVDIFFDTNVLDETTGRAIQSDNVPNIPIFRHNGTAVYSPSARNALSAFRTPLVLFSTESGQSSLSTLQKYPFDKYTAQIFLFAQDSQTNALVGLSINHTYGVAVGYKTTAYHSPFRGYPDVISELIVISRSPLVQAYVMIIVSAVWLITLMFMFATVSITCGYHLDVSIPVVPVATLFAITQLRDSMPGAPAGFGAIVDYVGLLPCLALMSISASLTIGALVFAHPDERHLSLWQRMFGLSDTKPKDEEQPVEIFDK